MLNINRQILAKQLRVIDEDGHVIGIFPFEESLALAEQAGKDLVEINPTAAPPVCKIMEYSKFLYTQKKAAKPKKSPEQKEFRFNINIAAHDMQTKANQIRTLLEKGHPIRITIRFHGREITHKDSGYEIINKLKSLLNDYIFNESKEEYKQLVTGIRPK